MLLRIEKTPFLLDLCRHSREQGNPEPKRQDLDSCIRRNDKCLAVLFYALKTLNCYVARNPTRNGLKKSPQPLFTRG